MKHLFDVNSEHSALTDCYNEITAIIKEKFEIDFDNEVEQLGYFLFLENNKIKTLGFISGNFKINNIIPAVSRSLASETESIEKVEINHKTLTTLKMDNYRIVIYNEKLIWFCDEYEFKYFKEKSFSWGKAPEHIVDLSNKSKSFVSINKELWYKLFNYNPQKITLDLDSVDVISVYFNNSDIVFSAHLDTNKSAEVMKQQLDSFFEIYKNAKRQESINFEDINLETINQINSLYYSSRIIDIVDSLKIEVKENNLVILFPYNRTNYYNAISDFITNIAMPAYQKALEEYQKKDCFYAQHFYTKVVEKYNNENEPMLYSFDFYTLKDQGYIPHLYSFLENRGCNYSESGHLDNGGYIICTKHGPAVPLIKPCYSKERIAKEEDMLKCIVNKKIICEAVNGYNRKHSGEYSNDYEFKPEKSDSKTVELMLTHLNLKLLKEEGYLESDLLEIPDCEYYISENNGNEVSIGCKKHGVLTEDQLYEKEYDYYFRRPELAGKKGGYSPLKKRIRD